MPNLTVSPAQTDRAAAIGAKVKIVPINREGRAAQFPDVAGDKSILPTGVAEIIPASGDLVFDLAATPDGYYYLVQITYGKAMSRKVIQFTADARLEDLPNIELLLAEGARGELLATESSPEPEPTPGVDPNAVRAIIRETVAVWALMGMPIPNGVRVAAPPIELRFGWSATRQVADPTVFDTFFGQTEHEFAVPDFPVALQGEARLYGHIWIASEDGYDDVVQNINGRIGSALPVWRVADGQPLVIGGVRGRYYPSRALLPRRTYVGRLLTVMFPELVGQDIVADWARRGEPNPTQLAEQAGQAAAAAQAGIQQATMDAATAKAEASQAGTDAATALAAVRDLAAAFTAQLRQKLTNLVGIFSIGARLTLSRAGELSADEQITAAQKTKLDALPGIKSIGDRLTLDAQGKLSADEQAGGGGGGGGTYELIGFVSATPAHTGGGVQIGAALAEVTGMKIENFEPASATAEYLLEFQAEFTMRNSSGNFQNQHVEFRDLVGGVGTQIQDFSPTVVGTGNIAGNVAYRAKWKPGNTTSRTVAVYARRDAGQYFALYDLNFSMTRVK